MTHQFETVHVHLSQFPEQVHRDYLAGFHAKEINHKFHYDSVKQSQKWLKVHEAFSPSRNNEDCIRAYTDCFQAATTLLSDHTSLQLIGLGSGGGTKDQLFLSSLSKPNKHLIYYPVDVSLSLALISSQTVRQAFPQLSVQPIVCDLLHASELMSQRDSVQETGTKILTFFGMIPNFFPDQILPILSGFLHPQDLLLFSANLAPGDDYRQGIQTVLPQYDNDLTKDWLITVLTDVGIAPEDGSIIFEIEPDRTYPEVYRMTAYFVLNRSITFSLDNHLFEWEKEERIRLFFSYRYTTPMIRKILNHHQIDVVSTWETANQEEGIYLCRKQSN